MKEDLSKNTEFSGDLNCNCANRRCQNPPEEGGDVIMKKYKNQIACATERKPEGGERNAL